MKRQTQQRIGIKLQRLKEPRKQYLTLSPSQRLNQQSYAVFELPGQVVQKHKELPMVASQRQYIKINQKSQVQVYGEFALSYQQNLRRTVLNHAKKLFKHKNKSFTQKVTLPRSIHVNRKSKSIITYQQQSLKHAENNLSILHKVIKHQESNLSILHKIILKETNDIPRETRFVSIEANRLPMIMRKQSKKQRSHSNYLSKHKWQPRLDEKSHQNTKYSKYGYGRRDENAVQICGWEYQQYSDF